MMNTTRHAVCTSLLMGALAAACGGDDSDKKADLDAATQHDSGASDAGVKADSGSTSAPGCSIGYECNAPSGLYICTKAQGEVITCDSNGGCPFGQCYPLAGQGVCIAICTPTGGFPTEVSIKGRVAEFVPGKGKTGFSETSQEPALSAVQVCAETPDPVKAAAGCTQTSADGTFSLDHIAPNKNPTAQVPVTLSFKKDGYIPQLQAVSLGNGSQTIANQVRLMTTAYATLVATASQSKLPDETTGWLQAEAIRFDANGADTAYSYKEGNLQLKTLDDVAITSDRDAGVGPIYTDALENPLAGGLDAGVAATTVSGEAFFVGEPAGSLKLTFKHPTLNCGSTAISATVVPGFVFAGVSTACGAGVR